VLLAIFGYHFLHVAQRWITIALVVVLAVYVVGLVTGGHFPSGAFSPSVGFSWEPFLMVVSAATAYQLSWAFFVSDYSRYLPPDTHKGKLMAWTWLGLLGTFTFEAVGAVGAALLPKDDIITALHETGNYVFPGMGAIMLVVGGLGLLGLTAMCVYGGSLTLITALDSVRPIRPSVSARMVTILLVGVTGAIAGASLSSDFLNNQFYTILTVLGYMMAPWTSINLTDFFVVRKGHYSVREMFKPDGIYGLWNLRGIAAYVITFVIMLPFMYLTFYQGFVATALNGIDIAFFVGVPVGCVTYWLLCRNLQLSDEATVVDESDRDLQVLAEPIA
jgi:purine-cytosine permease-like protein